MHRNSKGDDKDAGIMIRRMFGIAENAVKTPNFPKSGTVSTYTIDVRGIVVSVTR